MPLAKVHSAAVVGLDAYPVEVEVDISQGLPSFAIVETQTYNFILKLRCLSPIWGLEVIVRDL